MRPTSTCIAAAAALLLAACSGSTGRSPSQPPPADPTDQPGSTPSGDPSTPSTPATPPPPSGPGWQVAAAESFDAALPAGQFAVDPVPDDGPFADAGAYFTQRGLTPPAAFRASVPFGTDGWLTAEAYTRRAGAALAQQAEVVPDPANPSNHVLRVSSPEHTDALVIRPTAPLPTRYRISLSVGFAAFGDGKPGKNGYSAGDERAGPWWPDTLSTSQNGFYWLAILDQQPRPHNNTWIHHHRKLVVDSDNHSPPWMEIWNGRQFLSSGERPVMMIALDGSRPADEKTGNAFYSWSAGQWQPSGAIRAVDRYLPDTWYRVTVERDGPSYTMEVSGRFEFGGETTYRATIDSRARCVWHWPADAAEAASASACVDPSGYPSAPSVQRWPAGGAWPDWFMFGDPHSNFYEGSVLYDDVVLETWKA